MVRAAQKGEAKASSPEVARVAATASTTDVKKFASTKHKGLPEKKKMNEEGYDHLRDMGRVRPSKDKKDATTMPRSYKPSSPRKGKSALEIVKKSITDKYGKGAIMNLKKEGTAYGIYKGDGKMKIGAKKKEDKNKQEVKAVPADTMEGMYDVDPKTGESPVAASVRKGNKKSGDKRLRHFAKLAKKMVGEETLTERQKDSDNQRLSLERGRSNYGKASIRNMRASGKGGNAADPAERLVAMDARHKAHKEKRGVKTKGMKEEVYTGPKKGDLKGYGSKAFKEYEKNMDPKKRQALKDKATKGMKFTHESVGRAVADTVINDKKVKSEIGGVVSDAIRSKRNTIRKIRREKPLPPTNEAKDTSAMKKFLDDKAKKLEKKRNSQSDAAKNNPHFDSTSSMPRSKVYAGLQLSGDPRLGKLLEGLTAKQRFKRDAGAIAKKKMRQKEHNKYVNFLDVDEALHPNVARNDAINKANAMKRAKEREASKPSADVIAARKRQYKGGSDYTAADRKKVIQSYKKEETILETPKGDAGKDTPTKQADRAARSYGSGYGAKYNAPARKTIHKMKRGVKKYKGEKENNDGSTKMTNFIDDRKSHFHTQGKSYDEPSRKKMKKEEVAISEKIKYDSKGSSMDYFLGKDPKKTKYYKDNKKKNESKSSCECKHESFSDFLKEGNATARMLHKSKTQVTGHISADRGSDEKKNQSKRKGLEKDLKKHGIGHKKGVGEYKYDSGETGREVSYQTSKPDKMSKRRFGKVMRRLGRKHGQESVITKDKDKPAKLHTTEKGSKQKSETIGKSKAGKHPQGYGETSGTKVRSAKLPKKTNKPSYHYG